MKREVPRPVSRGYGHRSRIVRRQRAFPSIELPDQDQVHAEIGGQHEPAGGIRLHHVRVWAFVAADGEAAGRRAGGADGAWRTGVVFNVGGGTERTVRPDGENGNGAPGIVGHRTYLPEGCTLKCAGPAPCELTVLSDVRRPEERSME